MIFFLLFQDRFVSLFQVNAVQGILGRFPFSGKKVGMLMAMKIAVLYNVALFSCKGVPLGTSIW